MTNAIYGLYAVGAAWLVSSTFAIDHFDLFGVKQGTGIDIYEMLGFGLTGTFSTRLHLNYCRHPIMWGFFCIFFVTPVMTLNHIFFAVNYTTYILIAVKMFEEPDLRAMFPEGYAAYEKTTPSYCPFGNFFTSSGKESKVKDN